MGEPKYCGCGIRAGGPNFCAPHAPKPALPNDARGVYWQRQYAIESERANRATAQIREALAVLESGTEYERLHLRGILEAGL